jgi:hypothetical protein
VEGGEEGGEGGIIMMGLGVLSNKFEGLPNLGVPNICGVVNFCYPLISGVNINWEIKHFWSQKICWSQKNVWLNKFEGEQVFGVRKNVGLNKD